MTTALPTGTLHERLLAGNVLRTYSRQSLDKDDQRESIAIQDSGMERLCAALGITPEQWAKRVAYSDVDRSGDDFSGREDLQRLLREIKRGDILVAWKQDRVGRDMIDSVSVIRELVKYRGVALFTAETGTTPVTLDSAEQTAIVMFRGMVAQGELERIRSRVREGLRQRARDGFATGSVPFGYRTVLVDPTVTDRKKSKKRIEIDDALAPLVRRIFQLYADGYGYGKIARILNADGAPSPKGTGWAPSTIWPMLREERYVGVWTHGKQRVVSRSGGRRVRRAAPDSDVIRVQRPELGIIDTDLFARVKAALERRSVKNTKAVMNGHAWAGVHMLSGALRCGLCGGPLRVQSSQSARTAWRRRYYVCPNRRAGMCQTATWLPADEVEAAVAQHLQDEVMPQLQDTVQTLIRAEVARVAENDTTRSAHADALKAQLDDLAKERRRLVRVAAASDEAVPEVVEALTANQERTKKLSDGLAIATRQALAPERAQQLETIALEQLGRMRDMLSGGHGREVVTALFPSGLRFKVGSGVWLIEGAASVPAVYDPDEARSRPGEDRFDPGSV